MASGLELADVRVKIVAPNANPDLRIALIRNVESADFALVDDSGVGDENACLSAGAVKRVRLVADTEPSDITIALSDEPAVGNLKLYVHSSRFGRRDAAALFAAFKYDQDSAAFNALESVDSW